MITVANCPWYKVGCPDAIIWMKTPGTPSTNEQKVPWPILNTCCTECMVSLAVCLLYGWMMRMFVRPYLSTFQGPCYLQFNSCVSAVPISIPWFAANGSNFEYNSTQLDFTAADACSPNFTYVFKVLLDAIYTSTVDTYFHTISSPTDNNN